MVKARSLRSWKWKTTTIIIIRVLELTSCEEFVHIKSWHQCRPTSRQPSTSKKCRSCICNHSATSWKWVTFGQGDLVMAIHLIHLLLLFLVSCSSPCWWDSVSYSKVMNIKADEHTQIHDSEHDNILSTAATDVGFGTKGWHGMA